MIHYFNPGHEAAVLNGSKHYQAPANHVWMQHDLAFLPAWYAAPGDFVLVHEPLPADFEKGIGHGLATAIPISELASYTTLLANQTVDIWGISSQSCHFLEQLSAQHRLNWTVPKWKDEYRTLGSRQTAQRVLSHLIENFPEIDKTLVPQFITNLDEIEQIMEKTTHKMLVKAPHSSSGNGLVWLPAGKLAQSERQILRGMLRKQSAVSLEKALDKRLDFSMHFEITAAHAAPSTNFIGYSLFQTNAKGAYEKSLILAQDAIEKQLSELIPITVLNTVKHHLQQIINEIYAPHYQGNIGVDMLIYLDDNKLKLHPCVEINMRKSMGYLALRLFERFRSGELHVGYQLPITNYQLPVAGCQFLCPVTENSCFQAYFVF